MAAVQSDAAATALEDGPRFVVFLNGFNSSSGFDDATSELDPTNHAVRQDFERSVRAIRDEVPAVRVVYFSYGAGPLLKEGLDPAFAWQDDTYEDGNEPEYGQIQTTNYRIADHVRGLDWLIGDLLRRHPAGTIDLIGYSLGGIIAMAWAARAAPSGVPLGAIHRIVLLDSPVGGVNPAGTSRTVRDALLIKTGTYFGSGAVIRDIVWDGSVIAELRAVADVVDVASIENANDFLVNGVTLPSASVLGLSGALGKGAAIAEVIPIEQTYYADLGGSDRRNDLGAITDVHRLILVGASPYLARARKHLASLVATDGPIWTGGRRGRPGICRTAARSCYDNWPACGPQGSDCYCATSDRGPFCFQSQSCRQLDTCESSADCPEGAACILHSCCSTAVCAFACGNGIVTIAVGDAEDGGPSMVDQGGSTTAPASDSESGGEIVAAEPATDDSDPVVATDGTDLAVEFLGAWIGTGVQENPPAEWPIVVELTGGGVGQVIGTVSYPSLACGGEYVLQRVAGGFVEAIEDITENVEACADNGPATFELAADGTLLYGWRSPDGDTTASATLVRSDGGVAAIQPSDDGPSGDEPTGGGAAGAVVLSFAAGEWDGGLYRGDGEWYGRPWVAVYGADSEHPRAALTFALDAELGGDATLTVGGLDDEWDSQVTIAVEVNGVEVFAGPSPFANWDGLGQGEDAAWTDAVFAVPAGLLRAGDNDIAVSNLEPAANVGGPPYVLLGEATLDAG